MIVECIEVNGLGAVTGWVEERYDSQSSIESIAGICWTVCDGEGD